MSSPDKSEHDSVSGTLLTELQLLLTKNVSENVKLISRIGNLVVETVKTAKTGDTENRSGKTTLLNRWLDFNLASCDILSTHTLAMYKNVVSAAEKIMAGNKALPSDSKTPEAKPLEIQLKGRQGAKIKSRFLLENHNDYQYDISFEAGELASLNGNVITASRIKFEPAVISLKPKEQVVITIAVDLKDDFVVGETYFSTVQMHGFSTKEIIVSITILPPPKKEKKKKQANSKKQRVKTGRSNNKSDKLVKKTSVKRAKKPIKSGL